jgi:RHH-type proline utilization regulon transcriptional repressor/proline dehydrogenase/delta 1-pyrroline-5-carboxylate dehydrogenase
MDWNGLDTLKFDNEAKAIAGLLASLSLTPDDRAIISSEAGKLVRKARQIGRGQGVVESFLQEFSLSTREGLALMCLAEALLRTPDEETRDRLIAEKIGSADWASHLGRSHSLFVNASTWGLMLTGKIVAIDDRAHSDLSGFIKVLAARLGEPMIRAAVARAIRIMGEQFVLGANLAAAAKRAGSEGFLCSFDMLGEGARTQKDADRYETAYAKAIAAVAALGPSNPVSSHGISVKLSALSPRYQAVQANSVWETLYPRLKRLALMAAQANINLTLDAEEADRLVISLQLLDRLAHDPDLGNWQGLGLAVQAYQKRAPAVIDALKGLAQTSGRRLMVRLVKGAYWDTEIKQAQLAGYPDYPVYTTKAATDLSYLVCAQALIAAAPHLYAQFASHNAHTLAAVRLMADRAGIIVEHQRLHGMGQALYRAASDQYGDIRLRAYAPVGGHEDLLPYLVRRLLENGANSSFVHALLDETIAPEAIVRDPVETVMANPGPHPKISVPGEIYGAARTNSAGLDLSIHAEREGLAVSLAALDARNLSAGPIINGATCAGLDPRPVVSPVDLTRTLGQVSDASLANIDAAFSLAKAAQPDWDRVGGKARASLLRSAADALEGDRDLLIALLSREAGKTLSDAVAEVREAADFCRYYAHLAETQFGAPDRLTGPAGETNHLSLHGRGVFVCISPWNFPLAIFTGQIAAALAAGNAVLAKPAEQTPIIAARVVQLFQANGLDGRLLALLPGPGQTVGSALCAHPGCDGVAFTGGFQTAQAINRALAARPGPIIPLIAETGGLNAMFIDSTAQREQVIDDVIASAFGSAGQRCSALRVLFVPKPTADSLIEGLKGAMDTLVLGDPADPATDIGPIIDAKAKAALIDYLAQRFDQAKVLHQVKPGPSLDNGTYFGPCLVQVTKSGLPRQEVFGPILHLVVYEPDQLETVAQALAGRGYGLTLGIHSRIERFAEQIRRIVPVGNTYINRGMTGAVVGVQPFGGEGLSGTGPKAGGPHSLFRFSLERAVSVNIMAQGGDPALLDL